MQHIHYRKDKSKGLRQRVGLDIIHLSLDVSFMLLFVAPAGLPLAGVTFMLDKYKLVCILSGNIYLLGVVYD